MENSFSALEEKVMKAVQLIKELRAEKEQVSRERDALESRFEALRADNERMQSELEEARSAAATVERYEEKRRVIEEKVGGLLEKLEEIG